MEQVAAKKNTRSPTKKNTGILSRTASENRPPIFSTVYGCYEGLFQNPYYYQQQRQASSLSLPASQKPPLLPLPIVPLSRNYSLPCAPRSLSLSPPTPRRSGPIRKQPKPRPIAAPKSKPTDRSAPELGRFGGGGEEFSLISPPPSSLPLPKFAMRPKLISCNAEAVGVGVDAGATDSLRRILRLP